MRYSIVDKTGVVVNIIEYDGETEFDPGPGLTLRETKSSDRIIRTNDEPEQVVLDQATTDVLRDALTKADTVEEVKTALLDAFVPDLPQQPQK